ncbi:MAG: TraM recognition domain-containing protein [Patescibacteria group bacterium]|nr:TraM recognition domain-containing protein [Patescibacteria group bacterium]
MEKNFLNSASSKFNSPQEELTFLKEKIKQKEAEINNESTSPKEELAEKAVEETLHQYSKTNPKETLEPSHEIKGEETNSIILDLEPRDSDEKISELLGVLEEKGIRNTLTIIQKMDNPSLTDDFHRVLIQYLKKGYSIDRLPVKSPIFKILKMTLYEISLLDKENDSEKTLKEMISSMEQFYAGMLSAPDTKNKYANYFSLEIAIPNNSDEVTFYISVPDERKDLFEKQILSVFPDAKIKEEKDDYNIFTENFSISGSYLTLAKKPVFPIKTYADFDYDPLNIVLSSFSKIGKEEGASIQIIFNSRDYAYNQKYKEALIKIQKGVPPHKALDIPDTATAHLTKSIKEVLSTTPANKEINSPIDDELVENIKNKINSPIIQTNIRLISSSQDQSKADRILSEMEATFNQFENSGSNKIVFKKLRKNSLKKLLHDFSFREFNKKQATPLSLKEITTIFHFPNTGIKVSHQLKQTKSKSSPAPLSLPKQGTLLGINTYHNEKTNIYISPEDRLRHFYIVGQTGTGKTVLLKNMIIQDIKNGEGVCYIDPHGTDIQDILANIPPERYDDVIYFDPANVKHPMGLNMLEYDADYPEQKTFVVNEMLSIFRKLYGNTPESMGPAFEQYFRNAVQLIIDDPNDHSTLLDIAKVLVNAEFRKEKLAKCKNPIVTQFWREIAEKSSGDASLENIVPYITNKFDVFLSNDMMRPIVSQAKSSFNFRQIMDEKKILLVNLSKGRLGDINSHLLGLIIVGKILMATLSRVDTTTTPPPFYLYIDEFQNITTDSISTILSEARKYGLSLNIAHQFIAQLDEGIRDSVFGNVGSMAVFRVGQDDAEYLSKQFEPAFDAKDITSIDNWNAYLKILANGQPQAPFNIQTIAPQQDNPENIEKLKELSNLKYGKDRELIEKEIMKKYN